MYSNEADENGNYPFSTSATYICIEGYGLVEGVSARMCMGDGSSTIGSFVGNSSTCAGIYAYNCCFFSMHIHLGTVLM